MSDGRWTLTPDELAEVERDHRKLMRLQAMDTEPIRMSCVGGDLRGQAESIASQLIEQFAEDDAGGPPANDE